MEQLLPLKKPVNHNGYELRRTSDQLPSGDFEIKVRRRYKKNDKWTYSKSLTVYASTIDDATKAFDRTAVIHGIDAGLSEQYLATLRADVRDEIRRGGTVNDLLDVFDRARAAAVNRGRIEQDTYKRDQLPMSTIRQYIGHFVVDDLTPDDIVIHLFDPMAADGLSQWSQYHVFRLLRTVWGSRYRRRFSSYNVIEDLDEIDRPSKPMPDPAKEQAKLVTVDKARALYRHLISTEPNGYSVAITLCLLLGLRRGEAQALTWSDVHIDDDEPYIRVCQTLDKSNRIKEPKADKIRTVPIGLTLKNYLKKWREVQQQQFSGSLTVRVYDPKNKKSYHVDHGCSKPWTDSVNVCTTAEGLGIKYFGLTDYRNKLFSQFGLGVLTKEKVLNANGEQARYGTGRPKYRTHYVGADMHSLRDFVATQSQQMGIGIRDTQALLGHGQVTTTLTHYVKAIPASERTAVQQIEDVLSMQKASDYRYADNEIDEEYLDIGFDVDVVPPFMLE